MTYALLLKSDILRNNLYCGINFPNGLTGGGVITKILTLGFKFMSLLTISYALVAVPLTSGGKWCVTNSILVASFEFLYV
jgi:hypothetical protein